MKVRWDADIPNIRRNKINVHNHQPEYAAMLYSSGMFIANTKRLPPVSFSTSPQGTSHPWLSSAVFGVERSDSGWCHHSNQLTIKSTQNTMQRWVMMSFFECHISSMLNFLKMRIFGLVHVTDFNLGPSEASARNQMFAIFFTSTII